MYSVWDFGINYALDLNLISQEFYDLSSFLELFLA